MAGKKLSLNVALRLSKEQFQNGLKSAEAQIERFRRRVTTFTASMIGGGFALSGMVRGAISLARETNRAEVTLKNITKSQTDYVRSLALTRKLAKEYGQDLNDLTNTYAKMRAAGDKAGIAVGTQEKMYKSFIRTFSAFNMTRSESGLAMLALEQMLSKGKISAEELRRQLGEKVPIAMAAMANAAGVPISQLDTLLKQGKLLSSEIMPKFAEELEKMTPNVDTDNIETALRRLRNTFNELIGKLDIGNIFKKLVKGFDSFIKHATKSVSNFAAYMAAAIGMATAGKVRKHGENRVNETALVLTEKEQNEATANKAVEAAQKRYNREHGIIEEEEPKEESVYSVSKRTEKERTKAEREYEKNLSAYNAAKEKQLKADENYQKQLTEIEEKAQKDRERIAPSGQPSRAELKARKDHADRVRKIEEDALKKRKSISDHYKAIEKGEVTVLGNKEKEYARLSKERDQIDAEIAVRESERATYHKERDKAKRARQRLRTRKVVKLQAQSASTGIPSDDPDLLKYEATRKNSREIEANAQAKSSAVTKQIGELGNRRFAVSKEMQGIRESDFGVAKVEAERTARTQESEAQLQRDLANIEKEKQAGLAAVEAVTERRKSSAAEQHEKAIARTEELHEKAVASEQALNEASDAHDEAKRQAQAQSYEELKDAQEAQSKAHHEAEIARMKARRVQMQNSYKFAYKELRKEHGKFSAGVRAGLIRVRGMAINVVTRVASVAKAAVVRIGALLKSALSTMAFSAVLGALTWIVGKIVDSVKEAKKLKNVVADTKAEIEKAGNALDEESGRLMVIQSLLKDEKTTREEHNRLLNEANALLGTAIGNEETINSLISNRLELRRQDAMMAKAQELYNQGVETRDELYEKALKNKNVKAYAEKHGKEETLKILSQEKKIPYNTGNYGVHEYADKDREAAAVQEYALSAKNFLGTSRFYDFQAANQKVATAESQIQTAGKKSEDERQKIVVTYENEYKKEIANAKTPEEEKDIKKKYVGLYDRDKGYTSSTLFDQIKKELNLTNTVTTPTKKENPIEKAQNEYAERLTEIAKQKEAGLLTEQEAEEEQLRAQNRFVTAILNAVNSLDEAQGIGGFSEALKAVLEAKKETDEYTKQTAKYNEKLEELKRAKESGILTEEKYTEAVNEATRRYLESALVLADLTEEEKNALLARKQSNDDAIAKQSLKNAPKSEERDRTFDYKKTEAEQLGEELERLKNESSELDDYLKSADNGSDLFKAQRERAEALKKAIEDVDRAYKRVSVSEDVKDLHNEVTSLWKGALKGVADSVRDLTQGFKSMWDALEGDGTAIEKIMAIVNVLIRMAETVASLTERFRKLHETREIATKAENTLSTLPSGEATSQMGGSIIGGILGGAGAGAGEDLGEGAKKLNAIAKAQEAVNAAAAAEGVVIAATMPIKKLEDAQAAESTAVHLAAASAKVAEANALIPVVGAITAAAQIAMLIAAVSRAKNFAHGGLVDYGSTWGDTTHAFVNKGERILSKGNQDWIEGLARNARGTAATAGRVEVSGRFELENRKLVASINKENQRWTR